MTATPLHSESQDAPSATMAAGLPNSGLSSATGRSSKAVLAGRILTGIAVLFLTFDVTMKLARVKEAVEGTAQLGFSPDVMLPLGIIELVCLLLYLVPRTAPLGALFFTAYLGGAVAIHVRLGNPMFTHMLSPVYVALFLWGGLYLRDVRVRAALGPRR